MGLNVHQAFGPPIGLSVHQGIYSVFEHYCKPLKSATSASKDVVEHTSMDGPSLTRLVRECPNLARIMDRTDIDLIFSKSKPYSMRRLDYEHFLDALLEMAIKIYPDEDPTRALALLLSNYIFGLFDQAPDASKDVLEEVYQELLIKQ